MKQDELTLFLPAIVLAAPLAYLGMQRWLETISFRIDISWWIFIIAGSLALAIALLTVMERRRIDGKLRSGPCFE